MRLENFEVASSVVLEFEGKFWDLHNSAYFRGFQISASENEAVMTWSSLNTPSLPGRHGMKLVFAGVQFVHITARDEDLPPDEDTCVSDILRVDPKVQHPDPYMRQVSESADHFRLVFCFQGGRTFEIESDTVKLTPVSNEASAEFDL